MDLNGWITLAIVGCLLVALVRNVAPPDILFLAAGCLLALLKIITPNEVFQGFSNHSMLTVAVLFVVVAGLRDTGVLDLVGYHVLGGAKTELAGLSRLAGVVVPMSAFLNNTPIVAMFVPVVLDWCRRNGIAPSKMLIPLSFLTILGGTCTLIGTSTNLVVNGLMVSAGMPGLSLFELSKIGIPYAIFGTLYLFVIGRRLLPERKELLEQLGDERREYLVEMQVQPTCRLVGKTIEAAGLRQLPGLFLIEIDREGQTIGPVGPDDIIMKNDRL
ncbi:MAG: SLC13 family permease, partial [Gemmataceae bacterium]